MVATGYTGGGGGGGTPANTVVAETSFGQTPVVGVSIDYSRGDHSHGTPTAPTPTAAQLDPNGAIYGLSLGVLGPYEMGSSAISLSAGTLILNRKWIPSAMPINTLGTWMRVAGVTANGVNGMALYSSAGLLLGQTLDMSAEFALADQYVSKALTAQVNLLANTAVYFAIMSHFSGGNPSISGKVVGVNMIAINGSRPSIFLTGQASFPASITLGSANVNDAAYSLFGS